MLTVKLKPNTNTVAWSHRNHLPCFQGDTDMGRHVNIDAFFHSVTLPQSYINFAGDTANHDDNSSPLDFHLAPT